GPFLYLANKYQFQDRIRFYHLYPAGYIQPAVRRTMTGRGASHTQSSRQLRHSFAHIKSSFIGAIFCTCVSTTKESPEDWFKVAFQKIWKLPNCAPGRCFYNRGRSLIRWESPSHLGALSYSIRSRTKCMLPIMLPWQGS